MKPRRKLIYGVGVNDSPTKVDRHVEVGGVRVRVKCPIYVKWKGMFDRCFDEKHHLKTHQSYLGCSIHPDWIYFTNFKAWVKSQDWEEKQLDKDLLLKGNKVYSPEYCCFLNQQVNMFLCARTKSRGIHPIGATYDKAKSKFKSHCCNPFTKICENLGYFPTALEAHYAWKSRKHHYACQLADLETDPRIKEALVSRFSPSSDWINE